MTTAVLQQVQRRTFDVYSKADGVVHLVLEELADGRSIAVKLAEGTKSKLGSYWPVEAHEWLQKLDAKYNPVLSMSARSLRVSSDQPVEKWVGAAVSLLSNIYPLPFIPMVSWSSAEEGYWRVHKFADLSSVIAKVVLPEAANRFYTLHGGSVYVYLKRRGVDRDKCSLPISVVRNMVELQVARECNENGVPLDYERMYLRMLANRRRQYEIERAAAIVARKARKRKVVTVELPPMPRQRKRTRAGIPVEQNKD